MARHELRGSQTTSRPRAARRRANHPRRNDHVVVRPSGARPVERLTLSLKRSPSPSSMSRDYEFDDDEPYVVIEKQSGTLNSFFVGLAIGAGLALLFAPQSGEQTRRGLQRRARRARRAARRVANDVTDTV